jgi:hypothetical protein
MKEESRPVRRLPGNYTAPSIADDSALLEVCRGRGTVPAQALRLLEEPT